MFTDPLTSPASNILMFQPTESCQINVSMRYTRLTPSHDTPATVHDRSTAVTYNRESGLCGLVSVVSTVKSHTLRCHLHCNLPLIYTRFTHRWSLKHKCIHTVWFSVHKNILLAYSSVQNLIIVYNNKQVFFPKSDGHHMKIALILYKATCSLE